MRVAERLARALRNSRKLNASAAADEILAALDSSAIEQSIRCSLLLISCHVTLARPLRLPLQTHRDHLDRVALPLRIVAGLSS